MNASSQNRRERQRIMDLIQDYRSKGYTVVEPNHADQLPEFLRNSNYLAHWERACMRPPATEAFKITRNPVFALNLPCTGITIKIAGREPDRTLETVSRNAFSKGSV